MAPVLQSEETDVFTEWLDHLADRRGKAKILARLDRLRHGNPGDVAPVGEGISELRIDYGPGYRIYYLQKATVLVFLLCGGDKSTQARDIVRAKSLAKEIKGSTSWQSKPAPTTAPTISPMKRPSQPISKK
jgi:putative addiction module killer protein